MTWFTSHAFSTKSKELSIYSTKTLRHTTKVPGCGGFLTGAAHGAGRDADLPANKDQCKHQNI
jgi:hypothetical protein